MLPVVQQTAQYRDFTNAVLFDVIRYITQNDAEQIEKCFDEVLATLLINDVGDMCSVDKFCLLLDIRSMYLGDQLELQTSDNKKVKVKISTMLNNLVWQLAGCVTSTTIEVGDVNIDVGIPKNMLINDYDKLVEQSIINVHHDDDTYSFNHFTPAERQSFVDSLPAETLHNITQHIKYIQQTTDDLFLIQHNESMGIQGVNIGVYNNSMLEVLKTLYTEDLMNFYEMQFSLITKMRVTYDHFMKMTPSESKIYINLYNKDIKKQEEVMNKQHQNNHPASRGIGGV
jgi:T4 bacteriophage base plate protein